jgi:MoaA/NifB/PqqE/SkfB family radical SAM enzyme
MNIGQLAIDILRNRAGGVPRPRWCTYLVCFHCNARCGMCDSWRMKRGAELTPEQVRTVFAKIGRLDVVRLTGGEPFLRDDFLEVAVAVQETSRASVVHITTNGSLPERVSDFVRRFPQPERLRFMVSFDGLAAEHDANRGARVTFAKAIETVVALAGFGRGVKVSVNHTVISDTSLTDHQALKQQFAALGVDVHAVLAYADSSMYGRQHHGQRAATLIPIRGYPLHPQLQASDALGFTRRQLAELPEIRDPLLRIGKRYYLRGLEQRLAGQPDPQPKPRCVALRSHLRLLPDGGVPVCQFNTERVGNLLTDDFETVWHGSAAGAQRDWVDACSGCWAECEVMPNAIFSGDLVKETVLGR